MKTFIKLNDYFYLVTEHGKFLRKVNWINEYFFEWNGGYAQIDQLKENNNSKVKYILYEE